MLRSLRIRNLAIVDDLTVEFSAGFCAVTGETGAGKSVILGAIQAALGERVDKGAVRAGADQAAVEAEWELSGSLLTLANTFCESNGLESCEEGRLRVRRVVSATGQNKQFVNGSPASVSAVKILGDKLADLHGPHEHQSLLSIDIHRELLDRHAGHQSLSAQVAHAFGQWRVAEDAAKVLRAETLASDQEMARLEHDCTEIERVAPTVSEEEELSAKIDAASHAVKLSELAASAVALLDESDTSVLNQLGALDRSLAEAARLDSRVKALEEALHPARAALDELLRDLEDYREEIELDPAELARCEERYSLLQSLKRRYGPSLQDVLDRCARGREKLSRFENREAVLRQADEEAAAAHKSFRELAQKLSSARAVAAPALSQKITDQLRDLGFAKAVLEVSCSLCAEPGPWGLDRIEFLFAPNPGEGLRPLKSIASSGELARVMLATKTVLAEQDTVPLLIFDEADANVGGGVGTQIGHKMRGIAATHQVLSITHLPQVAALAHSHFVVEKQVAGGRTTAHIRQLDAEGRISELARMLGGDPAAAQALAKSLLAPPSAVAHPKKRKASDV